MGFTFLRGKNAAYFAGALREVLYDRADIGRITRAVLEGLLSDLDSANCINNDAFPKWHEQGDGTGEAEIND